MKYQLVLQFAAHNVGDFEELIRLEEMLIVHLAPASEVDGHDFGENEFNIFILTNDPKDAFTRSEQVLQQQHPTQKLKVAYRRIGEEEFTLLWPPTASTFNIA